MDSVDGSSVDGRTVVDAGVDERDGSTIVAFC